MSGRQLRAPAELHVTPYVDSYEQESSSSEEDIDEPQPEKRRKKSKTKEPPEVEWVPGDLPEREIESGRFPNRLFMNEDCPAAKLSKESHPLDFLLVFLNDDVIDLIVKCTVRYAVQKGDHTFSLSKEEFLVFIAVFYISGYWPAPRRRMFWENADDANIAAISQSIRLRRFEDIFRYLHVCDNDHLDLNDKFAKVRPLLDLLNEVFLQNAPNETEVSVDESMIPYFGRHQCKQFMKLKPVRFGYKAFVAALLMGYCTFILLYQGKGSNFGNGPGVGLGESIVVKFCEVLQARYDVQFSFFFDNFFTNAKLISTLHERGMFATGTVRENRMAKCPIMKKKELSQKPRGEYVSYTTKEKTIVAVGWNDNGAVYLLSNETGVEPLQHAERYSLIEKKRVTVSQPQIVSRYNKFMGFVDQLDNNVANYRINIRSKKWYMPIVLWLFDVIMSNAWIAARRHGVNLDALTFRRQCCTAIMKKYGTPPSCPGPKKFDKVPKPARESHNDHLLITDQPKRRCAYCKTVKTPLACKRCEVPLHQKCFEPFHSQ